MTNETRNRIRQYTEELPHMKEKVFGALLMLVIATMVTVTSTYAWVTLSRAPEVSNITTSMAANGALEIALAKPDGSQPDEYDIDESIIDIDNSVTVTNLQWGNLVNLSDASYGISNIALRPAQLMKEILDNNPEAVPFQRAVYGEDGRITELVNDETFGYAKYKVGENGVGQLLTSSDRGVRAIASVKTEVSDETQSGYDEKVDAVNVAYNRVNDTYQNVTPQFSALGDIVSAYASDKLYSTTSNLGGYIEDMIPLFEAVAATMEEQKVAYVALANLQNYLICNETGATYKELTWDDLVFNQSQYSTDTVESSEDVKISLVGLSTFIEDCGTIQEDIKYLKQYAEDVEYNNSPYYWSGSYTDDSGTTVEDNSETGHELYTFVAHLVDYGTMRIDLDHENGTYENSVLVTGLGPDNASSLMAANNQKRTVFIMNGILHRLESTAIAPDFRINGNAECKLQLIVTVNGRATCYFLDEETRNYCAFAKNIRATIGSPLIPNDAVAEDTYAVAVDLWVRTNAETTCLTLEGAIVATENGGSSQYEGTNRVWGEELKSYMTNYAQSTTQGGGSCYVYYADTPEDMLRSLEVLKSMKVLFIENVYSADGKLVEANPLATAEMDTANYRSVNGRVTVPLVISESSTTYTYVDDMQTEQVGRAITTLYTDVPVCITAIIYLDGKSLGNEDVLAAAEIQGSLNIQFGSSTQLESVGSSEMEDDYRSVYATVSPKELDFDTYNSDAEITTNVTVSIDGEGEDPTSVTAFFVREINATQGSREEEMKFKRADDGTWVASYRFKAPGTYYLRQVRLDGVDYTLEEPAKVLVKGYNSSVDWSESGNYATVRTSGDTHSTTVYATFASSNPSRLPGSVKAVFTRDDSTTVVVPLTYNGSTWVGTATFTASGVYQLHYLLADGSYIDLPVAEDTYRTLDLSLGMYVTVEKERGSSVRDDYEEGMTYPKNVEVKVWNDANVEITGLKNLKLYYSNGGSTTTTIDTDLTWDDEAGSYLGTLPIESPGRYQFLWVTLGSDYLTECHNESPVYVVRSSKPVKFDTSSACTLNEENGIQYAPLAKDAKIDGIRVINATSAVQGTAVVYCEATEEYYTRDLNFDGSYSSDNGSGAKFYVNLPTYQENIGTEEEPEYKDMQDGKWSIVAISLWNCCDEEGNDRAQDDAILWVDNGELGQAYLNAQVNSIDVDRNHDFSELVTDVSAEVLVTLDPGTLSLGSDETLFGTIFQVADTGMSITITDGNWNPIPKDVDVTMMIQYNGNMNVEDSNGNVTVNNAKIYGYEVTTDANATYVIKLNSVLDAEEGKYTVSDVGVISTGSGDVSIDYWKYVGVYTVDSLVVKVNGTEYTGSIVGMPKSDYKYTIKTAAPTASSIQLLSEGEAEQCMGTTIFGYDAFKHEVTGTFLQEHNLSNTYVSLQVVSEDLLQTKITMNSAVIEGMSVTLGLEYQSGTCEEYGGYTYEGTTGYENISLKLEKSSTGAYAAPSAQTLLAGIYEPTVVTVTVGDSVEETEFSELLKEVNRGQVFKVYSMKPDLKIVAVSPGTDTEVTVSTNDDPRSNYLTANNATTFQAQNRYDAPESDTDEEYGRWAVVYMGYKEGAVAFTHQEACHQATSTGDSNNNYANFTQPEVKFLLRKGGDETAYIVETGVGTGVVALKNGEISAEISIGSIAVDDKTGSGWIDSHFNWNTMSSYCYVKYTTEAATLLGTVTIEDVTSTVTDEEGNTLATITRTLAAPVTISQPNQEDPTLKGDADGVTIEVDYAGNTCTYSDTNDSYDFPAMAELKATVTAKFGYHDPYLEEPEGAYDWTKVSADTTTAVYTFKMPLGNATLTGKAEKYPTVSFTSNDCATVTMTVTVDGQTENIVSGTTGVRPGETVTVTVDTGTDGNNSQIPSWCLPTVTPDTEVADWSKDANVSNDFVSIYTFKMPDATVTFNDPSATAMYQLTWTGNTALEFYVEDKNGVIANGNYAVPGNELTISLTATGGVNPTLTEPSDAEKIHSDAYTAQYTYSYNVPGGALNLAADAESYPVVNLDNDYASFAVYSNNSELTNYVAGDGVSIMPGNKVKVILSIDAYNTDDYYRPRMTEPSNVDDWDVVSEGDWQAVYTFTMPSEAVNIGKDGENVISATGRPVVTYDANGGTCGTSSAIYRGEEITLPTPTKTGSQFLGWYDAASGGTEVGDAGASYTPSVNITLYAQWEKTPYTITVSTSNATVKGVTNGQTAYYGDTITFTVTYSGDSDKTTSVKDANGNTVKTTGSYTFTMPASNVTITASSSCVTPDTLITLADGTQVRVDSLTGTEELLVWNMETGMLDSAPILFVDSESEAEFEIVHLYFSDGTDVKVISEHGFWDYDLNRYVYLDRYADRYVGHTFAKQNGDKLEQVKLVDVVIKEEITTAWSPVTAGHLCYFVNGMLSMPGGVGGLFNIFDVDPETMTYDYAAIERDIATYGLFTYEELNAICPLSEDMFNLAGGAYLKVSIGKGNLTMDELIGMITRYSKFFD